MLASEVSDSAARWRLLLHPAAPGPWNMGVDEALLQRAASPDSLPVLRCYHWAPACVSLGRFQSAGGLDCAHLKRLGIDVVRRPTGGRAILHDQEVTYAVVLPAGHPLAGRSVRASYAAIAGALARAITLLGGTVELAPERRRGGRGLPADAPAHRQDCFATPSDHEIVATGRKLVGSAQVRQAGALLQHGSILLAGYRSPEALFDRRPTGPRSIPSLGPMVTAPAAHDVANGHATQTEGPQAIPRRPPPAAPPADLSALLGRPITPAEVIESLVTAFSETFRITLEPDSLTPVERELAAELTNKYTAEEWTFAR